MYFHSCFTPYAKNESKQIEKKTSVGDNIKLSGEAVGLNLRELGFGNRYIIVTSKARKPNTKSR